eukprot:8592209-Pyramimonas_sp.AAC.1
MRRSRGRGVSRGSRESVRARLCVAHGREILATARALGVGAISGAEACLRLRKSNAINMKKHGSEPASLWAIREFLGKPILLLRTLEMLRQARPREVGDRAKAAERTKARIQERGKINHIGCSPRQELAREAKTVGSRRTLNIIRDDVQTLA